MKGIAALTIMTLIIVDVSSRPSTQLQALLDLLSSEELLLRDSVEERTDPGPRPRDTLLTPDSAPMPPNRAWLRLFSDFMNNQKKFRGRTKKSGGPARGCFGLKLERMGSRSGLGC